MREILFRGKTKDGEWVYWNELGEINFDLTDTEISLYVYLLNDELMFETIGQFIGLTDKNGKKIFEGDIVKGEHIERSIIAYGDAGFIYKKTQYLNKNWYFGCSIDDIDYGFGNGYVEIIGNIYDNNELLNKE